MSSVVLSAEHLLIDMEANLLRQMKKRAEDDGRVKVQTFFPACNTSPELHVNQSQRPAHRFTFNLKLKRTFSVRHFESEARLLNIDRKQRIVFKSFLLKL